MTDWTERSSPPSVGLTERSDPSSASWSERSGPPSVSWDDRDSPASAVHTERAQPSETWVRGRLPFSGWKLRSDGFREMVSGHLSSLTWSDPDSDGFCSLSIVSRLDMTTGFETSFRTDGFVELVAL